MKIVEPENRLTSFAQAALSSLLSPLGRAALVLLLVIFMLLKREDLRGRLVRLIGQGRISATTRAMDDASTRVARYLAMQLLVNTIYGTCVVVGLYFIGVPNAALMGCAGRNPSLHSLCRSLARHGNAARALAGGFQFLGQSDPYSRALCHFGSNQLQRGRAFALCIEHRRFFHRTHRRGGFLDLAVGTYGSGSGRAAHRLPCGNGPPRAEAGIPKRAFERGTGACTLRGMLSAPAFGWFG